MDLAGKKELVTKVGAKLSVARQCKLLGLNRTSMYYKEKQISDLEVEIKHIIDCLHTDHPAWGTRRITATLITKGYPIGRKLVRRYMQEMRIYAIYPKPNLSVPNKAHKIYPYLLRNLPITQPNQAGVVYRYYLYSHGQKLYVSYSYNRLAFSLYSRL